MSSNATTLDPFTAAFYQYNKDDRCKQGDAACLAAYQVPSQPFLAPWQYLPSTFLVPARSSGGR